MEDKAQAAPARSCFKRLRVLVDVEVTADFRQRWQDPNVERRAEEYLRLVDDFNAFIQDHRSQDHVRLHVNRIHKDLCSGCGAEWETYADEENGGRLSCATCGRVVSQ